MERKEKQGSWQRYADYAVKYGKRRRRKWEEREKKYHRKKSIVYYCPFPFSPLQLTFIAFPSPVFIYVLRGRLSATTSLAAWKHPQLTKP